MSNQDSVAENNMGSVSFEGDKADTAYKASGEKAHTALAILHSVEDTLNGGEAAPDFDETTFAGLEEEIAYFESNQKKIESLREFLANQSSQFRRDKEEVLLNKVQNQISTLSATLEIVVSGVTAKYERMQTELNVGKEPAEIEQKTQATIIEDTPNGWNRAKKVFTPVIAAAVAFALTGSKNLDAKNNAVMPPDVSPVTTQFTYESLQKIVSTIDKSLVDALNKAQTRLAMASIDSTTGAETTHFQGGGVPKDPETLFKTPAPEADTTAKVTEATVKSVEATPAMEQQANFELEDLPVGALIGPDVRGGMHDYFSHMKDMFPGTITTQYGSNYYEFLLNDAGQFVNQTPEFTQKLAAEKKYLDDMNAKETAMGNGNVAKLAVYYAGDAFTIGVKILKQIDVTSTSNGQEATTTLKPGSLLIHSDDGSLKIYPVVTEGHLLAPIATIDIVSAEQNANLIQPGQTTVALTENVVVKLDDLLKPNQRIIAEIAKPDFSNPAADQIVSVAPIGKMMDGTPVPPTATPTDVPASPFVAMTLTETPLDFALKQLEYTNQKALTPEELGVDKATAGLETTVTDGQNTQTFRLVTVGEITSAGKKISISQLEVNSDFAALLKKEGYSLDSSRPVEEVQFIFVKNAGEIQQIADKLGAKIVVREGLNMDGNVAGLRYAQMETKMPDGTKKYVDLVFATDAYIENYFNERTDMQGKVMTLQQTLPMFLSLEAVASFKLREMGLAGVKPGNKEIGQIVIELNDNKEPNVLAVNLSEN